MSGAPSTPPPPPPVWMPVASSATPMNYWPLLAFWGRAIGFILLFLGALILAVFENSPPNLANAIVTSNIMWVLGLAMIGGGAGVNLHWNLQRPRGAGPEEAQALVWDRRLNGLLFIVSTILLFLVMVVASSGR
ncbi:MAG TPA: hypothetical protein VFF67_00060 [Thermoplasmata archaeon]|nr:hypothetical protein [Thermoplasmata archaeon]